MYIVKTKKIVSHVFTPIRLVIAYLQY